MHLKRQNSWPPDLSAHNALNDCMWERHLAEKIVLIVHCIKEQMTKIMKNKLYEFVK